MLRYDKYARNTYPYDDGGLLREQGQNCKTFEESVATKLCESHRLHV